MKTSKVTLYEWTYSADLDDNLLEIDWPRIQQQIGEDCLRWLLKQPHNNCQLILAKNDSAERMESRRRLVAEFYDDRTAVSYHLMWAK